MMKKVLIMVIIIAIVGLVCFIYRDKINDIIVSLMEKRLDINEEKANIDELYIYGRNLNIKGTVKVDDEDFKSIKLLLYNNEFKYYDLNYVNDSNGTSFYISEDINGGIILDNIDKGKYYLFIEVKYSDEKKEYYALVNNTKYKKVVYYTMSDMNNKISIINEDSYPTMEIDVIDNTNNDVYDVLLDAGHGGSDSGASSGDYKESVLTYQIVSILKNKLEENGLKVKLSRDKEDQSVDSYGANGRAVIPHKYKTKYVLSIHLNSSSYKYVNGLEIYTANGINYSFAKDLAKNMHDKLGINYSRNQNYKISDGVYSRNFTDRDIQNSADEAKSKGRNVFDITTKSNYYYMIRETGGYMTGAYVDKRNEDSVGYNPYYDSNIGIESYILELGFITNEDELKNIINNKEKYVEVISETFSKYVFDNKKET